MNDLNTKIATLSPAKRALLELKLKNKKTSVKEQQTIPRRIDESSTSLPLSFAQQRMWLLEQMEPNNAAYLIPMAQRLLGKLNVKVLQQSLDAIVAHHEVLRTYFISSDDGNPIQAIGEPRSVDLEMIDLTEESKSNLQELLIQKSKQPFNLASDLMLRATLFKIDEQEHILLFVLHHIAADGWSVGILWQQLASVYEAFINGLPNPLPKLPIQYADFALWQRQWLSGEVLDNHLNYWKTQLGGTLPVLELPTDKPRPSIQNHQGAAQSLVLSKKLTEALKALSHSASTTPFMTLLAAFKTLLYRLTAQEDIIIGTPIAGRNQTETEQLVGCFLNTLALRTHLGGNPTFLEFLGRVRKVALDAYAHQDISFEKLLEELQPQRNLSRSPVFDVMFNFINTPETDLALAGLKVSSFELKETEAKFSMTLYARENLGELSLELVYQKALFSDARMNCFLNQFQYLLEQIVVTPDSLIGSYSLVTPESLALLPNPSAVLSEPNYELVTTMFTDWAKKAPEQTAICQGDRTWNYGKLSESAHTLAQSLLSQGVKRGEVVAVFGSRSFGLIASMMGVFLSGGVLLTIDPKLPSHRQQLLLQQSKAKHLLCVGGQRPQEEEIWQSLAVTYVDADTGVATNSKTNNTQATQLPALSPNDPAYVFFTSGTTGVPKGVLGCHKGLAHFLNWQRKTFTVNPQDRSGQLTGLSFDVVLRDIFLPLTSGATLCLPTDGDELEPTRILRWLESERISILHTVPSLAQSWLVNVPSEVSLRALKYIFFAGEPLKDTLVRRWRETFPEGGEIVNLYGPTETTLAKCYYQIPADIPPGVQPVGLPMWETQALVLGENNQLCGIGEPGQIVLRTPFRSLGYINASEENRSRFVKNPFSNVEQDLLYYTGDRGRYRPDGSLEILGRMDRQVKIRGIRIELREIETLLGEHPSVREVVVIVREDQPGDQRLVAYVISQTEQATTTNELRRFLKEKLPNYMLPSAFVMLDALPLTPNGKVDRQALPIPDRLSQETEETFVAPRDEVEGQLIEIWKEVLGIESVGLQDNFFEIGGHSLLAVKLFWQIEKTFGTNLPLATLFQSGTVEALANIIRQKKELAVNSEANNLQSLANIEGVANNNNQNERFSSWSSLVPIKPNGSKPPFFCVHAIAGNVLSYYELAQHLDPEQPFYGLQAQGLDGQQAPFTRMEDMASHYLKEIKTVQPKGPYFLGGHCFGGAVAYEIAQQLHTEGEKVALLAMLDTTGPLGQTRLPFIQRVPLHLKNLLQKGPIYIWQKSISWLPWLQVLVKYKLTKISNKVYKTGESEGDGVVPYNLRHFRVREANNEAGSQYDMKPYSGPLTVFGVEEELRVAGAGEGYKLLPNFGWDDYAIGGFEIHRIAGDHLSMFTEPHVKVLAEKLQACITKAANEATADERLPALALQKR
jgi:amino acid adenylation domain-containing protein